MASTLHNLAEEGYTAPPEDPLPLSKVHGVWLGDVGDINRVPSQAKEHMQHRGLRCIKCFVLLARDQDFSHRNGELWIDPMIFKRKWKGIHYKNDKVFCKNNHMVGNKRNTTWTNRTIDVPVLTIRKTTFVKNFVENPEFSEQVKDMLHCAGS
eukprot:TRINITY_DN5884_c0_g1_i4.p1 TRINITY_DN5884_c0_g1~~TRINITY_DN5884_c0_g1_i4.p1  ORF type:complete len:153 (-),score=26.90 TRINITY_DN5884_c0_g1_i4:139-597(-)